MDVERLVTWALRDQGLGWQPPSAAAGGQLAGLAELGTRIDTTGGLPPPSPALMTDDDAGVVLDVIRSALNGADAALVIEHGRAATRPDWCPEGAGEPRQVTDKRGRPRWLWERPGDKRSKRWPLMEWVGWSPEQVEAKRALYRRWHAALAVIVPVLNAQLANHLALAPAVASRPWAMRPTLVHSDDGTAEPLHRKRSGVLRASDRRRWVGSPPAPA